MRQRDATLPVRIGEPIAWREIAALGVPARAKIRHVTGQLYGLPKNRSCTFERRSRSRTRESAASCAASCAAGRPWADERRQGHLPLRRPPQLRRDARARPAARDHLSRGGEGTGKRRDLDEYDAYYKHLVLWDESDLHRSVVTPPPVILRSSGRRRATRNPPARRLARQQPCHTEKAPAGSRHECRRDCGFLGTRPAGVAPG